MSKHNEDMMKTPKNHGHLTKAQQSRRTFLKQATRVTLAVLATGSAMNAFGQGTESTFNAPPFARPPIPNACISPVGDAEQTLAAVVDTVVPGAAIDPEGKPGGLDGCAMNLLLDDFYPFKSMLGQLAGLIDLKARPKGGDFIELDYETRLAVLVEAQHDLPLLRLAFKAIRSAFYGGAYNAIGMDYVNYPGPNLGYSHIPDASFRRPVCNEKTDGWMP